MSTPADAWTCPFCALLCDRYAVAHSVPPRLQGSDCPRANDSLRHFDLAALSTRSPAAPSPGAPSSLVDGAPAALDDALDAAGQRLGAARQPLIGGLGTDVAGMRALYRLAARCGAIVDHAHGQAMQHALRALQDRGQFTTTLAEIETRADLVVCIGTQPGGSFPEFWRRCGAGSAGSPIGHVVFVGTPADPRLDARVSVETRDVDPRLDGRVSAETIDVDRQLDVRVSVETIDVDPLDALPLLNALVAGRPARAAPAALQGLAQRLLAARYAVLVWEAARLGTHGALLVESLQRLVDALNRHTRAASFALGGNDGAATAQQVVGWLSGLPLRSRIARDGIEHEPLRFGAERLLADGAVDALLWVSSFGPQLAPPATALPRIVLGHPALAASCAGADSVFVAVSTPGIGSDGHLFRADGVVALPLPRLLDDGLPTVASVAAALLERMR